jgi:hypothetical protein
LSTVTEHAFERHRHAGRPATTSAQPRGHVDRPRPHDRAPDVLYVPASFDRLDNSASAKIAEDLVARERLRVRRPEDGAHPLPEVRGTHAIQYLGGLRRSPVRWTTVPSLDACSVRFGAMKVRRWGAAAMLAGVVTAACSGHGATDAASTDPPVTSTTPAETGSASTASTSMSAPTPTSATSTATTTSSPTASRSPGPRDLAGLVAAMPHGDRSAAAAEKTARIALFVFDDANRNGGLTYVSHVLTNHSPLIAGILDAKNLRASKHVHVVGDPISNVRSHVDRIAGDSADVRMSYHYPAASGVTAAGEVTDDYPPFDVTEIYVMQYVGDQWRLSTTKAA